MKKLRLILTPDCDRNCEGCCNKQLDFNKIRKIDPLQLYAQYPQIILTGGEPLLFPELLLNQIQLIRQLNRFAKIILYTAYYKDPFKFAYFFNLVDGITCTLHEKKDTDFYLPSLIR